jgi:hypothetical protein
MTTKPKTRQAPAPKTTARKNGAKAAPSEPKREISKIRRLVTYWRFLEAEQAYQAAIAETYKESGERWRSPTTMRLSRGQDEADVDRVQGERL